MGFPSRWFYYTAIIMILQLFTIKLITQCYFTVVIDLLVLCSHLAFLRVHDVLDHSPPNAPKFQSYTLHLIASQHCNTLRVTHSCRDSLISFIKVSPQLAQDCVLTAYIHCQSDVKCYPRCHW
jgi:hypothetical protein